MLRSRRNPLLQTARALATRRGREQHGLFLVEGQRAIDTVLRHGATVRHLLCTPEQADSDLLGRCVATGAACVEVEPETLASVADVVTCDGLVALVEPPIPSIDAVLAPTRLVVLDGLQDPGNIGTALRTADAVGAAIVLAGSCADPLQPKVVRASAGAVVRVPWLRLNLDEARALVADSKREAVVLDSRGGQDLHVSPLPLPLALVVGSEAHGPSEVWSALPRRRLPMRPGAESLNAAVALAITLYESVRQAGDMA